VNNGENDIRVEEVASKELERDSQHLAEFDDKFTALTIGRRASILQSRRSRIKPVTSSRTVDWARNLTLEPSDRTTADGGSRLREETVPIIITTMNALQSMVQSESPDQDSLYQLTM
jgi:hypothetical protein